VPAMKRSILAALLMVAVTAPAVHGQAKLLPPVDAVGRDESSNRDEPPSSLPEPAPTARIATIGQPIALPAQNPVAKPPPPTALPHQMYGREPAHGTRTAGEPQPQQVPTFPTTLPAPVIPVVGPCEPRQQFWVEADGLVWFVPGDRLPALLTSSPNGTPQGQAGILGAAGTTVLAGDRAFNDDTRGGMRINLGYWLDPMQTLGLQAGGFWLGNNNSSSVFSSTGNPILARPFVDATTGLQSAELIAYPGVSSGSVIVTGHSALDGWDVAFRQNAGCWCNGRLDAFLGYRQLYLGDQLAIGESSTASGSPGSQLIRLDQFDTRNNFYGAEFGFASECHWGGWVLEGLVKVAAGWNVSYVNINGATLAGTTSSGGLLALPSNIGVYRHTDTTLIPEAGVNLAYNFSDHLRLRGGYSFLSWDHVERPGQQIDTTINPNLVPPGSGGGPNRPVQVRDSTDLFVHGINLGFEVRY
jgi:Putative beta barrel porin-7 (BBP7)